MISIERSLRTAITALAFGMLPASGGIAMAGSLGGPLQLQDEGSFFVNGQQIRGGMSFEEMRSVIEQHLHGAAKPA